MNYMAVGIWLAFSGVTEYASMWEYCPKATDERSIYCPIQHNM